MSLMNDETGDSQPNILLITASNAITPIPGDHDGGGLERLASTGVTFTNAFSPVASEHGAWLAIVTGQYPQRWGIFTAGQSGENPELTIDEALGEVGYTISTTFEPEFAPTPYFCQLEVSAESADAEIANILDDLEEAEGLTETIVIYTSLASMPGQPVPLIMSWPGTLEPATSTKLVSLLDLFPTFAGLAGLEVTDTSALKADGLNLFEILDTDLEHATLYNDDGVNWRARSPQYTLTNRDGLQLTDNATGASVTSEYPHVVEELHDRYTLWRSVMDHGPLA